MSRTAKVSRACIEEIKRLRRVGHDRSFVFHGDRTDGLILTYFDGCYHFDLFANGRTAQNTDADEHYYEQRHDGCSERAIEMRNHYKAAEEAARYPEGE